MSLVYLLWTFSRPVIYCNRRLCIWSLSSVFDPHPAEVSAVVYSFIPALWRDLFSNHFMPLSSLSLIIICQSCRVQTDPSHMSVEPMSRFMFPLVLVGERWLVSYCAQFDVMHIPVFKLYCESLCLCSLFLGIWNNFTLMTHRKNKNLLKKKNGNQNKNSKLNVDSSSAVHFIKENVGLCFKKIPLNIFFTWL